MTDARTDAGQVMEKVSRQTDRIKLSNERTYSRSGMGIMIMYYLLLNP